MRDEESFGSCRGCGNPFGISQVLGNRWAIPTSLTGPTTGLFRIEGGFSQGRGIGVGGLVAVPGDGGVSRVTRAVFDHFVEPMGDPRFAVMDITPLMEAIRAMLKIEPDDGWRTGTYRGKNLWLIPNEVGGLTLMFPEDY